MDKQNPNNTGTENKNKDQATRTSNFKITGDWKAQSELLKEKFPQLTDSDLKYEQGQEDALLTRVETKLNKQRDEVVNIISKGNAPKA